MSNANRIVARNPANPEGRRRPKKWHLKQPGITVYRGISKAGRHYYHSGDGIPASLPYVCAVSRKPYQRQLGPHEGVLSQRHPGAGSR